MRLYALDTDILTLFQKGHPAVCGHVLRHPQEEIATTVLSVEEQLSGWYSEIRQAKNADRLALAYKRLAACVRFLADLQILDFTEAAIDRYEDLLELKLKIGRTDLRIAATAIEHGAIVVTRNAADFQHIPALRIEDWSR